MMKQSAVEQASIEETNPQERVVEFSLQGAEGTDAKLGRVLKAAYEDKHQLYDAYMPFVKGGGLFIHTTETYELGDSVKLSIQLLGEPEVYSVEGVTTWITPRAASGVRPVGVGVAFNSDDENAVTIRNKIETYLGGALKSENPTDTL